MKQGVLIYGRILAVLQIGAILALLALGWRGFAENLWLISGVVVAAMIGGNAIMAIRLNKVKIAPEPAADSELCTRGIYRWIRHPMYAASLLLTATFTVGASSMLSAGLWLGLLTVLNLKMRLEERLWLRHSPEYAAYMGRTRRLIPFFY